MFVLQHTVQSFVHCFVVTSVLSEVLTAPPTGLAYIQQPFSLELCDNNDVLENNKKGLS